MDSSLIIQTGFNCSEKIELCHVENFVKEIFDHFNIEIKEFDFSYGKTNKYLKYTQKNLEKFRQAYRNENIEQMYFYSLNTSDFEPNSLLIISLTFDEGVGLLKCIIAAPLIPDDQFGCFIDLCKIINNHFPMSKCCAFLVPEMYYPLSLSEGILRETVVLCEYKNIACWIRSYSTKLTIIGNYNYVGSVDEKIKDDIISVLDNSKYIIKDDALFFSLSGKENIGDLILTDKYNKMSKVLIEHNLLEKNEYLDCL